MILTDCVVFAHLYGHVRNTKRKENCSIPALNLLQKRNKLAVAGAGEKYQLPAWSRWGGGATPWRIEIYLAV